MIKININKARDIVHETRRLSRSQEFEPLDQIIAKQIPGHDHTEAENQSQEIRDRYAQIQTQIDQTSDVEQLKNILLDLQKTVDKV